MKTSPTRKFVVIGAKGGSITLGPEYRSALGPYAVSKAAVHYVAKKLQYEHEDFGEWLFDGGMSRLKEGKGDD